MGQTGAHGSKSLESWWREDRILRVDPVLSSRLDGCLPATWSFFVGALSGDSFHVLRSLVRNCTDPLCTHSHGWGVRDSKGSVPAEADKDNFELCESREKGTQTESTKRENAECSREPYRVATRMACGKEWAIRMNNA